MEPPDSQVDISPRAVARRLGRWGLLCAIAAGPSFIWASSEFNDWAMFTGIGFFVVLYTALTSTRWVARIRSRPFVRRTFYIGYGTRVAASVLFPVGMALDLVPGLISIGAVNSLWVEMRETDFVPTLAITILQGCMLNAILAVYMLIVYGVQRLFCRPEPGPGCCRRCGYDLRASYQFGRCPECGTPCEEAPAPGLSGHGDQPGRVPLSP